MIEAGIMKLIINYLEKFDNVSKGDFEKYWLQAIKCFELIAEMAKTGKYNYCCYNIYTN